MAGPCDLPFVTSGGFLDFTVSKTSGADVKPLGGAIYEAADSLKVHVPTPLGQVMGMANPVSKTRSFPANVTCLGHG
jgi:hypothetical protein